MKARSTSLASASAAKARPASKVGAGESANAAIGDEFGTEPAEMVLVLPGQPPPS